ncbi:MAG TPA: hypothetical protein VHQ23_14575 [Ilumatobacteraceae bacterium]|nr:hypothetical protein [Ilumatobacteraceae bacterium]
MNRHQQSAVCRDRFGIDRGVWESSTNAAERDDNISDFDTNEQKRHGRLRDRHARQQGRQADVPERLIALLNIHKL